MSNFDRAVKALNDVDEAIDHLADNEAYVTALEAAGLLAPDTQVIRTPEQMEELAQKDPNAVVLAGFVGVPRPACTLYKMYRAGQEWTLPAVIIATGTQARAAREAMEVINE